MNNVKELLTIKNLAKFFGIFTVGFVVLAIVAGVINSIGVTTSTDEVKQSVSYATERVNDASLLKGQEKILIKGVAGEKTIIYEVRSKDGQELSREVKSETITKQPIAEKIAIGTYVEPASTPIVQTPQAPTQPSVSANTGSDTGISTNRSPSSGVKNVVTGYCNDGTLVTGDPSARGKANACYGKGGWRDY